jgi:hypothetical protein
MFIACVSARRRLNGLKLLSLRARPAGASFSRPRGPGPRSPGVGRAAPASASGVNDRRFRATRLRSTLPVRLGWAASGRRSRPRGAGLTDERRRRVWRSAERGRALRLRLWLREAVVYE